MLRRELLVVCVGIGAATLAAPREAHAALDQTIRNQFETVIYWLNGGWTPDATRTSELSDVNSLVNSSYGLLARGTVGKFRTGSAINWATEAEPDTYNWIHIANLNGRSIAISPDHGSHAVPVAPGIHPDGSPYTRGVDYCEHSTISYAVYARIYGGVHMMGYGQKWGKSYSGGCSYSVSNGPGAGVIADYGTDAVLVPPGFSELWIAELSWSHDHVIFSGPPSSVWWGSMFTWQLR
jgi:hypothetical protein